MPAGRLNVAATPRPSLSTPSRSGEPAIVETAPAVVITVWPNHDVFDAWIATPERDALTDSEVHRAVEYRPITRYDLAGGYVNLLALNALSLADLPEEDST